MVMTALIKGCVQAGDLERAWDTFDHMRFEICRPDEVSYSLMIHVCAKMQEQGFRADRYTYNALLNAAARRGDIERARRLFADMTMRQVAQRSEHCMVACS
ncbi:hypothetical protein THASP1DRAFT_13468 [Thamnocephalis sphaerospora]|uniref:Pentacotripeptide-repeat region of PRORP domain-containing protein n=1 Tax=Thamnocephalis sphaerospora TaxID=78915 RepID=A0A4P9XUT9_9FUNG|nr:hypothetical protein THASP1DRAFT_13468 [Thamnocephalis sphaerospora]|eukprot:RKP10003.1 hypothetical protein THASP1DRAFT_13468 [Thamnocephalis sphaerospora]